MKDNIKVGIIGCGLASTWHIDAVSTIEQAEICGLVDINPVNIQQAQQRIPDAKRKNLGTFTDYREMIERTEPDAVFVLTPHSLHYEQVGYALDHNAHVLCEKPLVLTAAEAEELALTAREKQRILYVSYQFNLYGGVRYAYEMIHTNKLGDIMYFNGMISINWRDIVEGWRKQHDISGGGMMMDSGSHLLALFLHLLKPEIHSIYVNSDTLGDTVDIVTNVLATFDTNRTAVLAAVGVGPFMFDVSVTGSRGTLSLRDLNSVMHIDATDFRRELGTYTTVNKWDPKTSETQHQTLNPTVEFLQAVALGNTPFGNADLAIDVARLSAAIYRSIASGTPVRVE